MLREKVAIHGKRLGVWLVAISALTAGVHLVTRSLVAKAYGPRPGTYHYVETQFDRTNGVPNLRKDLPMAIRSDGSRLEWKTMPSPDGTTHTIRTITDATRRTRTVVDDLTQSLITYKMGSDTAQSLRLAEATCQAMESRGTAEASRVLGHRAFRMEMDLPSKPVAKKLQSWYAPDLGCMLLREVLSAAEPGKPGVPLAMRELSSITYGEPDSKLFDPPLYTDRRPSEMMKLRDKLYGGNSSQMILDQSDAAWLASQANR